VPETVIARALCGLRGLAATSMARFVMSVSAIGVSMLAAPAPKSRAEMTSGSPLTGPIDPDGGKTSSSWAVPLPAASKSPSATPAEPRLLPREVALTMKCAPGVPPASVTTIGSLPRVGTCT
jgi:hypothetical protein